MVSGNYGTLGYGLVVISGGKGELKIYIERRKKKHKTTEASSKSYSSHLNLCWVLSALQSNSLSQVLF